jgi:hypothetical protein
MVNIGLVPPWLIAAGALISWLSAIGLVIAARSAQPRVTALTERAVVAVVISVFLTMYAFFAYNTQLGFALLPAGDALWLLRVGVLGLSFIGPAWLLLWATGRLVD